MSIKNYDNFKAPLFNLEEFNFLLLKSCHSYSLKYKLFFLFMNLSHEMVDTMIVGCQGLSRNSDLSLNLNS